MGNFAHLFTLTLTFMVLWFQTVQSQFETNLRMLQSADASGEVRSYYKSIALQGFKLGPLNLSRTAVRGKGFQVAKIAGLLALYSLSKQQRLREQILDS